MIKSIKRKDKSPNQIERRNIVGEGWGCGYEEVRQCASRKHDWNRGYTGGKVVLKGDGESIRAIACAKYRNGHKRGMCSR